eukprot:CAMPEP_0175120656 /NCGR_PEP_ID=MMETSP0087-20121206/739_1 /TAXON_ID=136419 /ORGANISM="Unknown Unknown, Strain D1" /LENGTH=255 /DNA_ID=CAMNT_0016402121 /DNA_START=311 /DNA_END=1075 /DNA_ORIENTATION=-
MAAVLGTTKLSVVNSRSTELLNEAAAKRYEEICKQRLLHTPIQYLVGSWDFFNITLAVRPPVLIPRPETELLVEMILDHFSDQQPLHFLEVGTGSGAISLALLKARPQWRCTGIDVSEEAVSLTSINSQRLALDDRLDVRCCDVKQFSSTCCYDFIVSNPPYVPSGEIQNLQPEILQFEDFRALNGGEDGLMIINFLLSESWKWVVPGGTLWIETDRAHPAILRQRYSTMGQDDMSSRASAQPTRWKFDRTLNDW